MELSEEFSEFSGFSDSISGKLERHSNGRMVNLDQFLTMPIFTCVASCVTSKQIDALNEPQRRCGTLRGWGVGTWDSFVYWLPKCWRIFLDLFNIYCLKDSGQYFSIFYGVEPSRILKDSKEFFKLNKLANIKTLSNIKSKLLIKIHIN